MRRVRILSQILFFLLFLFLFIRTNYTGELIINAAVKFFLDVDPLIALTVILEHRGIPEGFSRLFVLSGILILMTMVLGRFFCGWVCPFGTIHHVAGLRKKLTKRSIQSGMYHHSQQWKYLFFWVIMMFSIFSLQIAGIFDPISFLIRSLTIAIMPALQFSADIISRFFLDLDLPVVTPSSEAVYGVLRYHVFPINMPLFSQNVFIGSLFILVLVLNRIKPRFWCRFICPLGALLGYCATTSRLQRNLAESCTKCNICHATCQGAPAKEGAEKWNPQECFLCFNCEKVCPENAISFSVKARKKKEDKVNGILPARRAVITSAGGAAVAGLLFLTSPGKTLANPKLIRPPGAIDEKEFLNRCVRCGACMKVCPANGLHPTLMEAGIEGIWSPRFIMTIGYCEYSCTLCGQVCPTGAIRHISETEKTQTKIGLAFINVNRCLPYAFSIPCIVCEEHCPTPRKAIIFDEKEVVNLQGDLVSLKFPKVDPKRCIGCGICENKCPVIDKPAIYVTSIGESRSEKNQLLLDTPPDPYGY